MSLLAFFNDLTVCRMAAVSAVVDAMEQGAIGAAAPPGAMNR